MKKFIVIIFMAGPVLAWTAPIGIPTPAFGIDETYRYYDTVGNRNVALTYNQNAEGGYCTHYIDPDDDDATDTDNPYGSPTLPRITIPYDDTDGDHHYVVTLPEGAVMEVHGTHDLQVIRPDGWLHGYLFDSAGTSSKPVFVRGPSAESPATIITSTADAYANNIEGTYIILENFEFDNSKVIIYEASDSAMRNCEVHNVERVNGRAVAINSSTDFVFYDNKVHHNWGTWEDDSKDMHNVVVVGLNTENIWIVDNELHHASYTTEDVVAKTGGDAVQVMGTDCDDLDNLEYWPKYIYVARNIMHHNTENSVDVKCSNYVVVSQNESYSNGFTSYSSTSMVNHENAHSTWFIFNTIHDERVGIRPEDAKIGAYVIGNVIYNVKYPVAEGTIYGNYVGGIWARIVETHIIGNTLYNVIGGTLIPSNDGNCTIYNNIVSRVQVYQEGDASWYHAGVEGGGDADDRALIDNNVFYQPAGVPYYTPEGVIKLKWGSTSYEGLTAFQKGVGKGLNCKEADPKFVDASGYDFDLQSDSPAIGAAKTDGMVSTVIALYESTFGESISFDMDGTPRSGSWDIGAYDYGEGGNGQKYLMAKNIERK